MRNLKKVLSLALALVMLVGMMVVGAGAAEYTDAGEIEYKEAADVMSAIGVFQGMDGGNFYPEGNLTRAQAAKIITYMLLGKTVADKLPNTNSKFVDCPEGEWYVGSINYLSDIGIVAGLGDGMFSPEGNVTGVQFSKMLLGALGYDAKIEKFENDPAWAANIAVLARLAGLDADMTVKTANSHAPLLREQACQMAFNTLKATMVYYNGGTNVTTPDGITVTVDADRYYVVNKAEADYQSDPRNTTMQFCEQYFPSLKLTNGKDNDDFGRPISVWSYDNEDIVTTPVLSNAAITYTSKQAESTVSRDLRSYDITGASLYENSGTTSTFTDKTAKGVADLTGNGRTVQLYTNEDKPKQIDKVVVIDTYVGDVTRVVAETDSRDAYVTITSRGKGLSGTFDTDAFEKGDVVLYTYSKSSKDKHIQSVTLADSVTGTLTRFSSNTGATVDGTVYPYAYNIVNKPASGNVDKEVTLILDTYGNVMDVPVGVADPTTQYAYVIKTGKSGIYSDTFYANLLLADNTKIDAKVKTDASSLKEKLVSYTVSDDVYTLTEVQKDFGTNSTNFELTRGNYYISTDSSNAIRASGSTIFFVKTGDNDYSAYTGIAAVPSVKATSDKKVSWQADVTDEAANSTNLAKVMFIDATATGVVSDAKDVIFIYNNGKVQSDTTSDGTYYEYPAIINGEETTIRCSEDLKDASGLYTSVVYNSKGIATSLTKGGTKAVGIKKVVNDVVGLGEGSYTYTSDVQVFYVDNDGNFTAPGIDGVTTDETDDVWFVTNGSNEVTAIFIQQVESDENDLKGFTVTVAGNEAKYVEANTATGNGTYTISSDVKVVVGDKITVKPTVSAEATVTSCKITKIGDNEQSDGATTYIAKKGDAGQKIVWTVEIVCESVESKNVTNTVTISVTLPNEITNKS